MSFLVYYAILFGTWFFTFLVYLSVHYPWLLPSYTYSSYVKSCNEVHDEYDYIIVGAGSAGSVVALRLAQDASLKILLVEAGPVGNALLDVPAAIPALQLSAVDWQYETTKQTHAAKALRDGRSNWPRGKIVGGSGRLNNMLYLRGHPEDYASWFSQEWRSQSFDQKEAFLKYYWKRSENQLGRYSNDTDWHGRGGPLSASDMPFRTKMSEVFAQAAEELNITQRDLNVHYSGFDVPQVNLHGGTRYSTGHHLLDQLASKPNLHLVASTEVIQIRFLHRYEASSILASAGPGLPSKEVRARHGIVLSAGSINTPKLLQLSGVGDPTHLQSLGIRPLIRQPQVGENLQDHIGVGVDSIILQKHLELNAHSLLSPLSIYDYLIHGKGVFTTVQCEGTIIGHTDCLLQDGMQESFLECEQRRLHDPPDLQLMVFPLGMTVDYGAHLYKIMGFNESMYNQHFASLHGTPTAFILPLLLHPKSTGYVRIASKNPWNKPIINPNYLSHFDDVQVLLRGVRFMQTLLKTNAMQSLGAVFDDRPFASCATHPYDSNDYWICCIRHLTFTIYHPVGTAALGSVLDYNFKLRGANKLFVADASILPNLPSSNPNAVVVAAAEMAADHIVNELILSRGRCHANEVFISKQSTSIFT